MVGHGNAIAVFIKTRMVVRAVTKIQTGVPAKHYTNRRTC